MKKCTSCGFLVNNDEALFCPECGNKLGSVIESVSETPAAAVSEPAPEEPSATFSPEPAPEAPAIPEMNSVSEMPESSSLSGMQPVPEAPAIPENTGFTEPVPMFGSADHNAVPEVSQIAAAHSDPQPAPAPQPEFTPQPAAVAPAQQIINSPDNPIVEKIDGNIDATGKVLGSPCFLIAAFGLAVSAIAFIISAVISFIDPVKIDLENIVNTINEYLYDFGVKISYEDYFEVSSSGGDIAGLIVSIILFIFLALSCIGMIKLFADRKKRPIPGSGFTLAKTNLVFRLVLVCICSAAFLCLLGGSFIFIIHLLVDKKLALSGFLAAFIALLTIVSIELIVLAILYYAGMLKTVSIAKRAGTEGKCPKNKVSVFALVINFIAAVGCILLAVIGILEIDEIASIISVINYIGLALYFGGIAASMLLLKNYLTEIPEVK